MSLAEELLADLEEEDDADTGYDNGDTETQDPQTISQEVKGGGTRLDELARLYRSSRLENILKEMARFDGMQRTLDKRTIVGPVEADPEYRLIVEANNIAAEIDNEIIVVHRVVREKYGKRFPELESLVVEPLEYLSTVREIGNDLNQVKNNPVLAQVLTQATIMVVSLTASTTQGELLSEGELKEVREACEQGLELNSIKLRIYEYVESRMSFIAPNLSAIVGASTAAKIMGVAGGLTNLSKMPACNVLLLGSQKKTLGGFSQVTALPHTGFIYHSQFVQDTPPDLRRKAARLVATKCTLAARVDASHQAQMGSIGIALRAEIEKKLDKLTEPPPVKFVKPLPKPIEPTRKKRGGKRVRKMKERYAMTELRKQANRLNFAEVEDDAYQEDLGYSRGTIGKGGGGGVRSAQVDEKTKVRISKTLQRSMAKQSSLGGGTSTLASRRHTTSSMGTSTTAGTASSVAFTPLQGLEIVNPQAAEKNLTDINNKYFSNTAGFVKINKT